MVFERTWIQMKKKNVLIKQHDSTDCGAAALAMVCLYYGKEVTLTSLRDACGTDILGTNIEGLCSGAKKLGLETMPIRISDDEFIKGEFTIPAICHTITKDGDSHYVVLVKLNKNGIIVLDPAFGKRKLKYEDFSKEFDNVIILVKPSSEFRASKIDKKSLFSKLMSLVLAQKWLFVTTIIAGLLITMLGIISSFFNKFLIDEILPFGLKDQLFVLVLIFIIIALTNIALSAVRQHITLHLSQKISIPLMLGYYTHIFNLPMKFFGTRKTGDIITRFGDAGTIVSVVSGIILTLILDIVFAIVTGVVLYTINPFLFGVILLFTLVSVVLVYIFRQPYKKINREQMEASALLNSTTIESLRGIETVKGNAAEEDSMEKIEKRFIKTLRIAYGANVLSNYQQVVSSSISMIGSLLIMWLGAVFVIDGQITLGTLMAFSSLTGFFMGPIGRLVNVQFQIQEADIALKRLSEILDVEEEGEIHKGKSVPETLFGNISVKNLSFRYGFRKPVLSDISFDVKGGEKVALVGESGCGKTTICKVLMGLWIPESGKINIAGYDLEELDMRSYRKRVAYVQQEVELFSGTITENIRISVPSATDDDIRGACDMAGCSNFISKLPSRYDTYLEEAGANLSGGERQRIGLARAFAKNPEILIIDEATSNLDFISEAKVYDTLFNRKSNCTTIIVAHRLSTIRKCDRIFMMAEGKIAESGDHNELIAKRGLYWKMWNSQVGNDTFPAIAGGLSSVHLPDADRLHEDDDFISYG